MKTNPILIISVLVLLCGISKAQTVKFISKHCYTSGQIETKTHTIKICYGKSMDDTDTLKIDNQTYFVLHDGSTGEQVKGNVYNWSNDFYGLMNKKTGRWLSEGSRDYELKCFVFVGNSPSNKKINKVFLYNHGASVTYLK